MDKIDEIVGMLKRSADEGGRDSSYIDRDHVYKMLGARNVTADEFMDGLLSSRAHVATLRFYSKEEEDRLMKEMPAAELIAKFGPMTPSDLKAWEDAGIFDRLEKEHEAKLKKERK